MAFGHKNQCQIFYMVDQNGENALARAYPVSDARDHRPGSATNGQGLPPGGRRRLKKLVQGRGRRLRKLKLASLNVGSMTGRSGEIVQLMRKKSLQVLCVQETTKWKGSKAREIGAGYKLYYHGEDGTKNGVGIVLSEDMKDRVLATDARLLKKAGKISDTWTYNGNILVKNARGEITQVRAIADLATYK